MATKCGRARLGLAAAGMATAMAGMVFASPASADFLDFNLTFGNSGAMGLFPGPYASVDVNRTSSTTAVITFTGLSAGGNIYLFGDGGSVAVNVNASQWSVSNIGFTQLAGFSGASFSAVKNGQPISGNEDGLGSYNQKIDNNGGYTQAVSQLSFTLTDGGGGTWASAADVLIGTAASDNFLAAAHIFVAAGPTADASAGALCTGFVAGNNVSPSPVNTAPGQPVQGCTAPSSSSGGGGGGGTVPEPATLLLFGAGLVVAGMARRRVAKSA